eukprot:gene11611-4853_t
MKVKVVTTEDGKTFTKPIEQETQNDSKIEQLNKENDTIKEEVISIIIIGAGMAGITAARQIEYDLKKTEKKIKITILEGRNRVGGRIHTINFSKNKTPVDLGASWIQGPSCDKVKILAKKFNFELVSKDWDSLFYSSSNKKLEYRYIEKMETKFSNILAQATRMPSKDIPLKECLDKYFKKANVKIKDEELFFGFLRDLELTEGGSVNEISAWQLDDSDDSSSSSSDEDADGDVMVKEGYGKLLEKNAEGLDIKLNHIVKSINYEDKFTIKIETDHGDFFADYCISTLPLGCLQKETVEFKPQLPKKKQKTINKIGMGLLDKVLLEFPTNFWGNEIEWITKYSKPNEADFSQFLSMEYVSPGSAILMAFCEADFAKKLESMNDVDVVNQAMKVLRSTFGNNVPDPLSYHITRWFQDPFCYGSYSFEKYGTTEKDRDILGESIENRLFFAGEATIGESGTYATGAFLSGKRDGKRISKLIQKSRK